MRKVIKKERVQVGEMHRIWTNEHGQETAARTPSGPGVRPVRVDGRVHAIEFTCRCGTVSIVEIEYEGAAAPTEVTS